MMKPFLSMLVLSLAAAHARAGETKTGKASLVIETAETLRMIAGCPKGWTFETFANGSASCYLNAKAFAPEKPVRWADIDYNWVGSSDQPGTFGDYIKDKDCETNKFPRLAGGFCGIRSGVVEVAGKEAVLFQTAPNRESAHKVLEVIADIGGYIFSIRMAAPADQYKDFQPIFGKVLGQIRAKTPRK